MGRASPVLLVKIELPQEQEDLGVLGVLAVQGPYDFQGLAVAMGVRIGEGRLPGQVPFEQLPPGGFVPEGRGLGKMPLLGVKPGQVDDGFLVGVPGAPGGFIGQMD